MFCTGSIFDLSPFLSTIFLYIKLLTTWKTYFSEFPRMMRPCWNASFMVSVEIFEFKRNPNFKVISNNFLSHLLGWTFRKMTSLICKENGNWFDFWFKFSSRRFLSLKKSNKNTDSRQKSCQNFKKTLYQLINYRIFCYEHFRKFKSSI